MSVNKDAYYLVRGDILPESIQKTIEAKRLLEKGEVQTAQEAVRRVNLSRSAFYKYKDAIFPFNSTMKQKIMTISVNLEHHAGALSNMLSYIARNRGNVLTINQTIPLQGLANVVVSIETSQMDVDATQFTYGLSKLEAVQRVSIIGHG
jgi:chorismate mutase